jgi:two-component system, cell cycle response regulator
MSVNIRARASSSVTLIAEADSVLGEWVATRLSKHQYQIDRSGVGEPLVGERVAAVILVEHESAIDPLRVTLDMSMTPTLVLVAARDLTERILPLLEPWHDLAPTTEPADVVAWRLQRLIDYARRSALGVHSLDALTGVLNRSAFERNVRHLAGSLSSDEAGGLVYLDLDSFKHINDRLGYKAGDNVLKTVGKLLERSLAPGDLVGRMDGDEFACALRRPDAASVRRDAERLLTAIANFAILQELAGPASARLTASAGLSFFRPGADVDRLLTEADQAMYQAKSAGRNRLEIFGAETNHEENTDQDSNLQHLENVTRVETERLIGMITSRSRKLLDAANETANVCALTGLRNRRYFNAQLPRDIQVAHLQGRALSLVLIDLDQFHDINATYGWPTGDRVLQAFAGVAQRTVRSSDWTVRYGGEEFGIVMPDTTLESAVQVAERFRQAFGASRIDALDGRHVTATFSAGVAQLPAGMVSTVEFANLASEALKVAKESGRNRVEQFRGTVSVVACEAQAVRRPATAVPGAGRFRLFARPATATATTTTTTIRRNDPFNLARFVDVQADMYDQFISQLRRGRKLTHCMWFTFPQLVGLGYSHESRHYGIRGLDEAAAYLAHPVLGARLRECAEALEALDPRLSVDDVFRYPDDLKLRSCLTLFALAAGPGSVFERLIGRYFEGSRDFISVARLQRRGVVETVAEA